MIAYVKTWLDNLSIQKVSARWAKAGLIEQAEQGNIVKNYKTEYREHNFFARIGIFIFVQIIVWSGFGLLSLMVFSGGSGERENVFKGVCIFYGGCCYLITELFVKENKYVKTGVTEGLLYSAIGFANTGIAWIVNGDGSSHPIAIFISILPLIAFCAIRFADVLLTIIAFVCLLVINALLLFELKKVGQMVLPFETMAFAFVCYRIVIKQKEKEGLQFWSNCLTMLEIASLATLYVAGNYMAIRMLTESLIGTIEPGDDIGFAPFFYAYTLIVPVVYVWLGLKRKNYIFMRLGLILFAAGILSIKYYHSFMPPETALMIGGIVMIVAAWFCIRYLKTPKYGITFAANEQSEKHKAMADIANVAISQVMTSQPRQVKPDKQFGGGDFGGGGAGADF